MSVRMPLRIASLTSVCLLALPLLAGDAQVDLALTGARILPVEGPAIPRGTILISGGKIKSVGADVIIPKGTRIARLDGKVVVPGLIDARSTLFLSPGEVSGAGSADRDVLDAADLYDDDALSALRRGVTTVFISPGSRGAIGGLSAVVKLGVDTELPPLRPHAALKLNLGVSTGERTSSLERLASYEALRSAFRSAEQYARSFERYERDIKRFESQPRTAAAEPTSQRPTDPPNQRPTTPTRPTRPRRVPAQEVLLRALKREIPVRIEAHRADDILNALRLADEFKLKLVLEKAEEAPVVAKEIARRGVPIVWGPTLLDSATALDARGQTPAGAAKLSRAGIRIALTPAAESGRATRFVLENAAAAAGHGLTRDAALRAITLDAARILGVSDRVGSIAPGKDADLVVFSAAPWDPAARVEQVYVNGVKVHGR